jgi:hypothetical protein
MHLEGKVYDLVIKDDKEMKMILKLLIFKLKLFNGEKNSALPVIKLLFT